MGKHQAFTDTDALLATRRTLMSLLVVVPLALQVVIASFRSTDITQLDQSAMIASVVIAGLGLALSDRTEGLWLLGCAFVPLIAVPAIQPTPGPAWLPFTTQLAYTGLMWVLLLPRWLGLLATIALAAYLRTVWVVLEPENIFLGGLKVADGWIQVAQTFGISFGMWLFWHPLLRSAKQVDEESQAIVESADRARAVEERSAAWRRAAVGIHESLLNSIRYVMSASTIDGQRLHAQIGAEVATPVPVPMDDTTLDEVVSALMHEARTWGVQVTSDEVPRAQLTNEGFEALRSAVGELVRNAVVHAGATEVHGAYRITARDVTVRIRTNQRHIPNSNAQAGMGTSMVLNTVLPSAGGRWREAVDGYDFEVSVPIAGGLRGEPFAPFDRGRVMISAPLVGATTAGVGYYYLLLAENRYQMFAGLFGIYSVTRLWRMMRNKLRIPSRTALGWMLSAACIPWLVQQNDAFCEDITLIAPAITIAGFSLIAMSVWANRWVGTVGLWIWGIGLFTMFPGADTACREAMLLPASNTLVVLPIIVTATYSSVRNYERFRESALRIRNRELQARTRAAVTKEIDATLRHDLERATSMLTEIADGAEFTGERRHELSLLDARIRASLQVPPDTVGMLTRTAAFLIREATAVGIPVRVRALVDTRNRAPVPLQVYRALLDLVLNSDDAEVSIQVFADGSREYLTVYATRAGLDAAHLHAGESLTMDEFSVDVDDAEPGSSRIAVVVSRRLADVSATPAIA